VDRLSAMHFKQILTYLRLSNLQVGLLINFGQSSLKAGIHRVVNRYVEP
jgi:iron complex transport system substrate-binding protein